MVRQSRRRRDGPERQRRLGSWNYPSLRGDRLGISGQDSSDFVVEVGDDSRFEGFSSHVEREGMFIHVIKHRE